MTIVAKFTSRCSFVQYHRGYNPTRSAQNNFSSSAIRHDRFIFLIFDLDNLFGVDILANYERIVK